VRQSDMRRLAVLATPLVLLAAAGCSAAEVSGAGSLASSASDVSSSPMTLAEAKSAWDLWGPASYRLTLVSACGERGGLGTYKVTVTPDKTTAEGTTRWSVGPDVQTVPDLFTFIEEATDGGADVVDVTYNSELGYPEKIKVDYMVNAIDDEACYTVKDFRPAEPIE